MPQEECIHGTCEHCGRYFEMKTIVEDNIIIRCPECGKAVDNWDTVEYPQLMH